MMVNTTHHNESTQQLNHAVTDVPHIFLLILLAHPNLVPAFLQLVVDDLSEHLKVDAEEQLQPALVNVVVSDPHQRIVELRVYRLYILHRQLLVQHLLVERHRKTRVDKPPVVQRLWQNSAGKLGSIRKYWVPVSNNVSNKTNFMFS
jgi:hypothetical protein